MGKRKSEANIPPPRSTDSRFDPNHYPPGQFPALTSDELQAIAQKAEQGQLPTSQELDAALGERHRATDKVEKMLATDRPDAGERALSATGTVRVTLSLDSLTVEGRDYRERQAKNARGKKTPHLDAAILAHIKDNPEATARERWDALSHFDEDDLEIRVEGETMEWDYMGDPQSSGDLQFTSFKSKVSRLKKRHPRR